MRKFFKTVAIVTVFSVCEKFLGFLYRIFLSRTIGSEGMGMYQVSLSVFALLLTVCCSGTPITVSRLMTKYKAEGNKEKVYKIITAGLSFTLMVAVPICAVCYMLGGKLGFLFADKRCVNIFLVVLPGLIFTSVYSVLRGVFWGEKDFIPYSVIELLEEMCMIIVGVILISRITDIYKGAFYAGFAVLISYIFSFSLATVVFFMRKNKLKNPKTEFRPLLSSALPVTAMRTANSLISSLVSVVLPIRLMVAGFTSSEALSAYGSALGQAMPILCIPSTITGSFTLVLIPEISEYFYSGKCKELQNDIEKAIKFTVFIASICMPVFFVCGEEIGIIIFDNPVGGEYLSKASLIMLLMGTSNITTSILNCIGLENKTLTYYIISALFMLLSVWVLPKFIGVYSLFIGFAFVYGITTVLNLILMNKECKCKPKYMKFCLCSFGTVVPTCIFGVMLENLLLPVLGIVFTFFIVSVALVIFNFLLYLCFGLISIDVARTKIKENMPKKFAIKKSED